MALTLSVFNRWVAVVPSDTVNQDGTTYSGSAAPKAIPFDSLYVGGAGTVTVVSQDGRTASFTAVAGEILPLRGIRVNSTGTAGTLIVALYSN